MDQLRAMHFAISESVQHFHRVVTNIVNNVDVIVHDNDTQNAIQQQHELLNYDRSWQHNIEVQ